MSLPIDEKGAITHRAEGGRSVLFLSYLAVFVAGAFFGILLIGLMAANDEKKERR